MTTHKKVTLDLEGIDGNAFSIIGAFRLQARKDGWSKEEIEAVTAAATTGDYEHLLRTIMEVCE